MKNSINKENKSDKDYRAKLYQENKEKYKQIRSDFIYGISLNFRSKRRNQTQEMEQFEKETMYANEEEYGNAD